MNSFKPSKKQLIIILLLLFGITIFVIFSEYKNLNETLKVLSVLNKKPGELTDVRISAGKTKPEPLVEGSILSLVTDVISEKPKGEKISKDKVIQEFRKKFSDDSDIENWTICDFASLSDVGFPKAYLSEVSSEIYDILDVISTEIASDCPNDLVCDPLFKEVSKFNEQAELDWVRKYSFARSTSDVLKIESNADQIKFFKALVLGDLMYAEVQNAEIDKTAALNMLVELKNKYKGNAIYSYYLMILKQQSKMDYKNELNDFLNSTYFDDPSSYFANYVFRQGLSSEALMTMSRARRFSVPTPAFWLGHDEILKSEIPKMNKVDRAKLDRLASEQYFIFLNSKGRIIGPNYYMENWLRRTHSKNVSLIQDAFEIRKDTSNDFEMWNSAMERINEGQCKKFDELNKVLTVDLDWFSELSRSKD